MAVLTRFERATSRFGILRSIRLSYRTMLAVTAGLEPTTSRFASERSIQLSYAT